MARKGAPTTGEDDPTRDRDTDPPTPADDPAGAATVPLLAAEEALETESPAEGLLAKIVKRLEAERAELENQLRQAAARKQTAAEQMAALDGKLNERQDAIAQPRETIEKLLTALLEQIVGQLQAIVDQMTVGTATTLPLQQRLQIQGDMIAQTDASLRKLYGEVTFRPQESELNRLQELKRTQDATYAQILATINELRTQYTQLQSTQTNIQNLLGREWNEQSRQLLTELAATYETLRTPLAAFKQGEEMLVQHHQDLKATREAELKEQERIEGIDAALGSIDLQIRLLQNGRDVLGKNREKRVTAEQAGLDLGNSAESLAATADTQIRELGVVLAGLRETRQRLAETLGQARDGAVSDQGRILTWIKTLTDLENRVEETARTYLKYATDDKSQKKGKALQALLDAIRTCNAVLDDRQAADPTANVGKLKENFEQAQASAVETVRGNNPTALTAHIRRLEEALRASMTQAEGQSQGIEQVLETLRNPELSASPAPVKAPAEPAPPAPAPALGDVIRADDEV